MAKKLINDDKMDAFIKKNWSDYQKSQKQTKTATPKKKTVKRGK